MNVIVNFYFIRAFSLGLGGSYPSPIQRLEIFDVEVLPSEKSFIFLNWLMGNNIVIPIKFRPFKLNFPSP